MKGLTLTMVTAAALLIGCNSSTDSQTETKAEAATAGGASTSKSSEARSTSGTAGSTASVSTSSSAAAAPEYQEVTKDGHIYVVASKASADKVRAGQKLAPTVTAFGFGPAGERVYFETDKEGKLDQVLMAEFTRRHPK